MARRVDIADEMARVERAAEFATVRPPGGEPVSALSRLRKARAALAGHRENFAAVEKDLAEAEKAIEDYLKADEHVEKTYLG